MNEIGFMHTTILHNTLVSMYTKCGSLGDACKLFERMPKRDVFSWNTIISGCAQNGQYEEALDIFPVIRVAGAKADSKTFGSFFSACANLESLEKCMEIYKEMCKGSYQVDVYVENAMIDMYAECGHIEKARDLFDKIPKRIRTSWNTVITG